MIKETEHFILDYIDRNLVTGQKATCDVVSSGLQIKIKNINGTSETFCFINSPVKQCRLEFVGTKLQDYITNWELFVELVQVIDEAVYRVDLAYKMHELNSYCE